MAEIKTFPVRLTPRANDLLRRAYHYRGDLSSQLALILNLVNLDRLNLKQFPTGRAAKDAAAEDRPTMQTSVRLPVDLHAKVKAAAQARNTSINVILNSAILAVLTTL